MERKFLFSEKNLTELISLFYILGLIEGTASFKDLLKVCFVSLNDPVWKEYYSDFLLKDESVDIIKSVLSVDTFNAKVKLDQFKTTEIAPGYFEFQDEPILKPFLEKLLDAKHRD